MKSLFRTASLAILMIAALHGSNSWAADSDSPIGLWKTFDDKTGAARAIVRIYEQDGRLFGRIEQSFTPGAEDRVCGACTDERKDKPIIGLARKSFVVPPGQGARVHDDVEKALQGEHISALDGRSIQPYLTYKLALLLNAELALARSEGVVELSVG